MLKVSIHPLLSSADYNLADQHPADMTDFQNQTAEYRRPRRDGANAMHISSVSSDGYGVRASGPSLSIQTTSSSSRQS